MSLNDANAICHIKELWRDSHSHKRGWMHGTGCCERTTTDAGPAWSPLTAYDVVYVYEIHAPKAD